MRTAPGINGSLRLSRLLQTVRAAVLCIPKKANAIFEPKRR